MKVLLLSHGPITTYQNMGKTFLSLLSTFQKEELCHLYIYPAIPDADLCCSQYRITDQDILRSYFHFGKVRGREILSSEIDPEKHEKYESQQAKQLYSRKKNYKTILARDFMWQFAWFMTEDLKAWLTREKPTCILLAPGEARFIYRMALKIASFLRIPLMVYVCDEFFFIDPPDSMLGKLQLRLLKNTIRKTLKASSGAVTICDSLNRQYSGYFGIPCHTIMTGTSFPIGEEIHCCADPRSITYMGNLAFHRYRSIGDIGRALDRINGKKGTDYCLNLYTPAWDDEIRQEFSGIRSIRYCGYVTGQAYREAFQSAEILLHTEGFDEKSRERVRNSVSTKIADSLGSGIPLFAYGPEGIASMEHLKACGGAVLCENPEELDQKLTELFENCDLRSEKAENGLKAALKYHQSEVSSRNLHRILSQLKGS